MNKSAEKKSDRGKRIDESEMKRMWREAAVQFLEQLIVRMQEDLTLKEMGEALSVLERIQKGYALLQDGGEDSLQEFVKAIQSIRKEFDRGL